MAIPETTELIRWIIQQRSPQTDLAGEFQIVPEEMNKKQLGKKLEMMNKKHAVVREGGKTVVITEEWDATLQRYVVSRSSFQSVRDWYCNQIVIAGYDDDGKPESENLGKWWLTHPERRDYESIGFSPGADIPGHYNLWRGFAVDAVQGDCSLFEDHLCANVCCWNPENFEYLMNWCAMTVQKPDELPETSIVMRGRQGTGKGVFARTFGSLFGQHYINISNTKHVTGNFNRHLQDCLILFADEAFGTHDQTDLGVLKMLITEPTIPIEAKGRDVVLARNFVHLIIASNADWVVPADFEERRFFVLDVSDEHIQDLDYFRAIDDQMKNGGREALLYELQNRDIEDFDPRHVPRTAALMDQKIRSMSSEVRWWFDKLIQGCLTNTDGGWPTELPTATLHKNFVANLGKTGRSDRSTITELGMFLQKQLPGRYPETTERKRGKDRVPVWQFPDLDTCRQYFAEKMSCDDWESLND